MNIKSLQRQLAVLLAAGLLSTAAFAQEGEATGEVNIEGETPAVSSPAPAEAAPSIGLPMKPQIVSRDPFVNTILSGEVYASYAPARTSRPAAAPSIAAAPQVTVPPAARGPQIEEEIEEEIIPAPEVTVTGIVSSGSGRYAIVNSGASSYLVTVGQKLADYRISAISTDSVTFSYSGKSFEIEMEDEFGLR